MAGYYALAPHLLRAENTFSNLRVADWSNPASLFIAGLVQPLPQQKENIR
jgi:hypothetical protein